MQDKQHIDSIHKIEKSTLSDRYSLNILKDIAKNQLYRYSTVVSDGIVVGYVIATCVAGESEILRIAIDKVFRGKGYGYDLIKYFINSVDADVIHLEVRIGNSAAVSLYEKAGFKRVGVRKGYYDDGEDALLYTYYK